MLFLAILKITAMKKIIGVIFGVVFALIFTTQGFAQTPTPQSPYPLNTEANVPQDIGTFSQVVFLQLLGSVSCQLSGINPIDPNGRCIGPTGNDGKLGFVESGGALGFMTRTMAATYDFPVSGGQYMNHLASNFGITKTANAQVGEGGGFRSLSPFIPIWSAFRNITYLFFVLIFVVIGLGIMFRVKIDPRSVMTIQNAIPKIIIALIFITFSYAIVGLLVDTMRVSTYFVYGVMAGIPGAELDGLKPSDIQGANPFTAANQLADSKAGIADIAWTVRGVVVGSIKDAIGLGPSGGINVDGLPVINGVGEIFGGLVRNIPGLDAVASFLSKVPIVGGLLDGLGNLAKDSISASTNNTFANYLIHGVSAIAGLLAGMRVADIQSNSPGGGFEGSILGVGGGITFIPGFLIGWPAGAIAGVAVTAFTETLLRELIPNLVAFFIILIAIFTAMVRLWFQLIKAYIYLFLYLVFAPFFIAIGILPGMGSGLGSWIRNVVSNLAVFPAAYVMLLLGKVLVDSVEKSNGDVFVPPLIGDFSNSMAGFSAILGLGILLLTPEVVNMVRSALKAPDLKLGSSIGRALGSGSGFVSSPIKGTWGKLWGTDSHGHDNYLTRKVGERWGWIARGFAGGPFRKTVDPGGTKEYKAVGGTHASSTPAATPAVPATPTPPSGSPTGGPTGSGSGSGGPTGGTGGPTP